jgi:hypothetical protein
MNKLAVPKISVSCHSRSTSEVFTGSPPGKYVSLAEVHSRLQDDLWLAGVTTCQSKPSWSAVDEGFRSQEVLNHGRRYTIHVDVVGAEESILPGELHSCVPSEAGEPGCYPRHTALIHRINPVPCAIERPTVRKSSSSWPVACWSATNLCDRAQ